MSPFILSFLSFLVVLSFVAGGACIGDGVHGAYVVTSETPGAILAPTGAHGLGVIASGLHGDIAQRTCTLALAASDTCVRHAKP